MPLVRYEIRNEYSLANPDLYRAAAKDDPEGLLEGVAMAGLVGIVRQLGDLAEFAAEVFHDLHEEILATAARGHELMIRVQQLESELPFLEKIMFNETKSNHDNFIYSQGIVWHSELRNDQNHFTQGDLPHFIRSAYEECRGPPRLFLLDKFDVAGAGACLKRYTDPFFFKMEWASTELMKAEKEQQDKRARRIKKKRQAVEFSSRASDNFALRQSEDGSRMVKDVHNGLVMQRQAGDSSSLTSENIATRSSEDGSRMLQVGYNAPVLGRQAVDISSLTSENVSLKTLEDGSRTLKDVYAAPSMERHAVDISSTTSKDVSKIQKDSDSAPVIQGQAVNVSLTRAENVVSRITEDDSRLLKDAYITSAMQRQGAEISSSTSESDDLKTMGDGSRMLKDDCTNPVMQRQGLDISSSISESVDLKTTVDGSRILKDAYPGSFIQRQSADINPVESKNASSNFPEEILRMPGNVVLTASVGSTLKTSEHAGVSIAEDATLRIPKESITKMSGDIVRMSEDTTVRILKDSAVRISEDAVPRICKYTSVKISEDAAVKMSEDAVVKMSEDAGLRTSEGPTFRTLAEHVLMTSDDDISKTIDITDDFASETENFVDALATMDSEAETDTEAKSKFEDEKEDYFVTSTKISSNNLAKPNLEKSMVNEETPYNDCQNEEQGAEKHIANVNFLQDSLESNFSHEEYAIENHQIGMMNIPAKENTIEKIDFAQQVSRLDIDGDVQSTMERIDLVQQVNRLNIDANVHYTYSDSLKENEGEKQVEESPRNINGSIDAYLLSKRDSDMFKADDHDESENIENIPETPETSETDDDGSVEAESLSDLPISTGASGDGSRGKFPKWRRSHSSERALQSTKEAFYRGSSDLSSEDSESELSDSLKETSPRSSANSSIRPIKWISKSHDSSSGSNDEMDGMQVSSASSSTMSSPRPSTLATTVFHVDSKEPIFISSPERSMKQSLVSHLSESPKSVASTGSPVSSGTVSPELTAENSTVPLDSSPAQPLIGSFAEPLESPGSEILRSTAAEPLIFDPKTMISTQDAALGSPVETLRYSSESFIFPSVESVRLHSEPFVTGSTGSTAAHASPLMAMNANLSLESNLPFQDNYTGSPRLMNIELEQFPPPPPLPPLQWLMSRRPQKPTSAVSKEGECASVSAPEDAPTVSDIKLTNFTPFVKELPALQILLSPRSRVETLDLQHTAVMFDEESRPVDKSSLDVQKFPSSPEVFEPSVEDMLQAPNERFSDSQDSLLHAYNLVRSQDINTSSTSDRSCESVSTKSIHSDTPQPTGDIIEEYPVEENVCMQSVILPYSQASVSSSTSLVNAETMMKSDSPLESCDNLRQLGSLEGVAPTEAFDASDTSYHESRKLLIKPDETQKPFEIMASPSVNRKRDVGVPVAVSPTENYQKCPILDEVENVKDYLVSDSEIQGSGVLADSPSRSSVCKGDDHTNFPGSKHDMHMPAATLDRSQNLNTHSSISGHTDDHTNFPGSKHDMYMPAAMLDRSQNLNTHSSVSGHTDEIMLSPDQFDEPVNSKPILLVRLQKKDPLIEAIASHDRSTLKKVPELSQSSRTVPSDERGVLLEQIRNRSFSLRQIKVEKQAPPQPVTNINVAAILEKANAIRQAFAGSDDEDDWSDG